MAKLTKQALAILYFEAQGAKEIPSRNKYRMMEMEMPVGNDGKSRRPYYFFFGSNGAIRGSFGKAADKSNSMTRFYEDKIKKWAEEVGYL